MSKAEKLVKDLKAVNYSVGSDYAYSTDALNIIKQHLQDAHNEAVDATVMAMNKKKFIKPEYKD